MYLVCVCLHVRGVCTCVYTVKRVEVDAMCPSLLMSTLIPETGFLTEPGAHHPFSSRLIDSEPQESSCLCPPSSGIASTSAVFGFLISVVLRGPNLGSHEVFKILL